MERELKLVVTDGDQLDALAAAPPLAGAERDDRRLRAAYYDTAEGHLRRAGVSLRIRHDGASSVQTVKAEGVAAAGLFARPEWERPIAAETPMVDETTGPVAAVIGSRPLEVRFRTDIRRRTFLIDWEGARIEAALDGGSVSSGAATAELTELELELKDGSLPALFGLARSLGARVPMRLGVRTKSERGHDLAEEAAAVARKAEPVRLDADGTVIDAFAAVANNGLRQFRLNEDLLLATADNGSSLHQARVGLRRLRSALSLFRPLLDGEGRAAPLGAALKRLAATLGEVRDLDVLLATADDALRSALADLRAEAFNRARAQLEAADTRALMLDLAEWLALGDWRVRPADPELAHGSIIPFAAHALDRARKRVKTRGHHLARLDAPGRHRVRIESKKLRYASEFFRSLWTGKKARQRADRFAETVEALQEELGKLNDRSHGAAVLAGLGLPARVVAPIGHKDLKRAEQAYEEMLAVKRFWR